MENAGGKSITTSGTSAEPQHSRKPDKVKSLAQYLANYVTYNIYGYNVDRWGTTKWRELLQQALDAYESTEQVKIRIEQA